MSYNFDIKLHEGNFDIQIDTAACYGYFEHDELGDECGGGLWFEIHSAPDLVGRVLYLIDYDGVAVLPGSVSKALRDNGFIVGKEFD